LEAASLRTVTPLILHKLLDALRGVIAEMTTTIEGLSTRTVKPKFDGE
jgi:hypothetical protein